MGTEVKYIITITNIVFAILFFTVLNAKIYAASNDLNFDQRFFAKDISYTINAMYSVDGDVEVLYVIDEKLDVKIKDGLVMVYYNEARESYPYVQDSKYDIKYSREEMTLLINKTKK